MLTQKEPCELGIAMQARRAWREDERASHAMRIIWTLLLNLWVLLRWPWLAMRRARAAPTGAWLAIVIDGPVVEIGRRQPWWGQRPRTVSLHAIRDVVALAREDSNVRGVLVTIRHLRGGSAIATSVRQALVETRTAGKRLVAYLPDGAGTRELLVASAADSVIAGPQTVISALGYALEVQHVKQALDRVGVEAEVIARGRYKTAAEFLTSPAMSDAQREQLEATLDTCFDELVRALSEGRKRDAETVRRWVDEGPWTADDAREHGIIDDIAYPDELARKLDPSSERGASMVPAGRYRSRRRIRWRSLVRKPIVAVVQVHGAIVSRDDDQMLPVADAEAICDVLDAVRDDRNVAGVIVHVNSRGGSAVASDRILRAMRRVRERKPVIACLGDVAASGGYMVAVGADAILAQPTTITGSIGVIGVRLVMGELMRKIGVTTSVVKRGERADMMTVTRHLSAGERGAWDRHIDQTYRAFLEAVAQGRGRAVDSIEPLAGGRVWSGKHAVERGLVDELGGFEAALARMKERLGAVGEVAEPMVVGGRSMLDMLSMLLIASPAAAGWLRGAGVTDLAWLAAGNERDRVLAWCEVVEQAR